MPVTKGAANHRETASFSHGGRPSLRYQGGNRSARRLHGSSIRHDACMATIQSAAEIQHLLEPLMGQKISVLQVLGINSLKTMLPPLEALAGEVVTAADVVDRTLRVDTTSHVISFDLQRTGRVVLLESAEPYRFVAGANRPTARLLMADGSGLDLVEPAKTKRITVTIGTRPV